MSSSQMTRKRLNSLKALTEELRDRTKNAPLDLSHIKELLSNSRQLHTSPTHRQPPAPDTGLRVDDLIPADSSFRPLFPDKSRTAEVDQEVLLLREENVGLEQKISKLREEISQLEDDKRQLESKVQNNNSMFCFKLSDSLEGFVGRLALPADNYDRLEYSAYDIELRLDKIVLLRKEKGAVQEFDLCGLRAAEYCGTNVVVLRFEEFLDEALHPLTSVFLKFYSEEHLQKWDLAIYANYHIVNSLEQKHLFQKYFRCLKLDQQAQAQNERIKAIRDSVELDHNKEKDLLKLLLQKREEYQEVKQLISLKLQHKIKANIALNKEEKELIGEEKVEEPETNPKQDIPQKPNITFTSPIGKIEELEPHQEESEPAIQPIIQPPSIPQQPMQNSYVHHSFNMKHTDSNTINFIEPTFNSPDSRISRLAPTLPMQSSSIQGNFPLSPPPLIPSNQSQLRDSGATLVNQLNNIQARTPSFQSSFRNNSISKSKQITQQRLNQARIKLQNGYYATKYSKDGFSPHDKKVFLSLDCRKLCWSERDKQSEYKSVPIAVLIGVEYGSVGQGIAKHVKNPDSRYFCVITYYTSDYKKKTIELGSGNMQDIKELSSELSIIIQKKQEVAPN